MMFTDFLRCLPILCGLVIANGLCAADTVKFVVPDAERPTASGGGEEAALSPEREALAIAFARTHHPEMADLVEKLRERHPVHFGKAVRDLARTQDRLQKLEAKSPERFESELASWKLDSRIRLLTARNAMKGSAEQGDQLKDLIAQRYDLRMAQQQKERTRLVERLQTLDAQLAEASAQREVSVQKEFDRLTKATRPPVPAKTKQK